MNRDEPPLRDSAGISPDFAELCVPTIAGPSTITPLVRRRKRIPWSRGRNDLAHPADLVV